MAPHLIPGLSAEEASHICIEQCKAMCCRGAIILTLGSSEVQGFIEQASAIDVTVIMTPTPDGGAWIRFSEHPGEHCPMLDDATSMCRIYADRPQRCRDFPVRLTPGCAISGG